MKEQELKQRRDELAKVFAEESEKLTFKDIEQIYKTGFDAAVNLLQNESEDDKEYCGAV